MTTMLVINPNAEEHGPSQMSLAIVAAKAVAVGFSIICKQDLPELSSQELLDCCMEEDTLCYTFWLKKAFNYIEASF
ncbi:hypothetical protein LOK49_LG07G01265 [Camellia lanceoleosa]|uniref:Uncharacterized protein n=1 Tax=Camellia lanceoleosa TaxID=1840588 RepID=A0ACC0H479_9ERIC|nr:hypothetical protein LOK49_LG07G01265 [Camellia lanceoleosa]